MKHNFHPLNLSLFRTPPQKHEHILHGIGVAKGIALGFSRKIEDNINEIPCYTLHKRKLNSEIMRFRQAHLDTNNDLCALKESLQHANKPAFEDLTYLIEAHISILNNPPFLQQIETHIKEAQTNAEYAVDQTIKKIRLVFENMEDPYLAARKHDIQEVGMRLIHTLMHKSTTPFKPDNLFEKNTILLCHTPHPGLLAQLNAQAVLGIAASYGGAEGHAAIIARAHNIPSVFGVHQDFSDIPDKTPILIDGKLGLLIINPSEKTLRAYQTLDKKLRLHQKTLHKIIDKPCQTLDGTIIELKGNIENSQDIKQFHHMNADGIGLFRSEFLFMNKDHLPSEDEQFELYYQALKEMPDKTITIRTLDIGCEKKLPLHFTPSQTEPANPALGLRAIRFSLHYQDMFMSQLRALLRASYYGNIEVLLPLITHIDEVTKTRELMNSAYQELQSSGIKLPKTLPRLGVMIEVPGVALAADTFAKAVDFFSIGSNDLTMYTLAIDRTDDKVAYLYNSLHPGVLRLMQFSIEAAKRAQIPINLCGELSSDPNYIPLLIGLGLRCFSLNATSLLLVKERIRQISVATCQDLADKIMMMTNPDDIYHLMREFNQQFD